MQSPRPGPPALEQDPGAANPREHTGGLGSRAVYLYLHFSSSCVPEAEACTF